MRLLLPIRYSRPFFARFSSSGSEPAIRIYGSLNRGRNVTRIPSMFPPDPVFPSKGHLRVRAWQPHALVRYFGLGVQGARGRVPTRQRAPPRLDANSITISGNEIDRKIHH